MSVLEHADRHFRHAAELARQRPFSAGTVAQNAAEHLRAGGDAGDLLDLRLAIDREEPDAERVGTSDVTLLLDRVAEGDTVGGAASGEHLLDLDHGRRVEARAEIGQQRQHFRRRIGLHGVENARVRQRPGEGRVVVAHDVEVEHHARAIVLASAASGSEKFDDTVSHRGIPSKGAGRAAPKRVDFGDGNAPHAARWRRGMLKHGCPDRRPRGTCQTTPDRVLRRGHRRTGRLWSLQFSVAFAWMG